MLLGLDNNYTCGARRLIAFADGHYSDRNAAELLKEVGCFTLSHSTIGNKATEIAAEIDTKLQNNSDIRKVFQEAAGDTEFTTDGAFINIRDEENTHCWQEVKVAVFSKRERGAGVLPEDWDKRNLPKPTVNMAIATLDRIDDFTLRCKEFRFNLGVGGGVSVLGDGAHWIWKLSAKLFGNTAECLDIFHASEHINDCGKVLFKDEAKQRCWFEDTRMLLLRSGFSGVNEELERLHSNDIFNEEQKGAIGSLQTYLCNNRERLHYRGRLAQGRSIGSGVVEGACKNLVGRRLKQTGACWRQQRAEKMAVICAAIYSNQWKHCWKA